jgi:hypothetical protein
MRKFSTSAEDKLYVPLSEKKASILVACNNALDMLKDLTDAEIASVLMIQHLTSFDQGRSRVFPAERLLANLVAWGVRQKQGGGSLVQEVERLFDVDKFSSGLNVLRDTGLELLSQDEVDAKEYLLGDGSWDFEYRFRHYKKVAAFKAEVETPKGKLLVLSAPQDLIVRSFLAEKDESFHIQGYAGTGKTHLISSLTKFMDPCATLVLAQTQAQLYHLTYRLQQGQIVARTFMMLAMELLVSKRPHLVEAADDYLNLSDSEVSRVLNIGSVGIITSARVTAICRKAVKKYCQSGDKYISRWHLPYIKEDVTPADVAVLVQYAERIWEATMSPPVYEVRFPVRGFHLIKYLSLTEEVVPENFTHVIVDESHDLSRPILKILDRSPQAVITLGDEYQCINGPVFKRSKNIRQRDITLSVRAGKKMEDILNPLIEAHPTKIKLPFEGGSNDGTKVVYYNVGKVPDRPSTILVDSEWGMFEWFQRLSHAGLRFALLHGSRQQFVSFMTDCINLFHRGTPPKHRILFFHRSWESLAQAQINNKAFEKIEAMLLRGYDIDKLKVSLLSLDDASPDGYQLGMVGDVKNAEFNSVMLAPDLLSEIKPGDVLGYDRKICALYTGGSRAKYELLVPGGIGEWIGSQKYNSTKNK